MHSCIECMNGKKFEMSKLEGPSYGIKTRPFSEMAKWNHAPTTLVYWTPRMFDLTVFTRDNLLNERPAGRRAENVEWTICV